MFNTVAAISTPLGKGGIAMIRISGEDALAVSSRVFAPKSNKSLCDYQPRYTVYGGFFDEKGFFDDGTAVYFKAPHSYTGEDTVELCCHGGVFVTKRLLCAVFTAGAVPAGPGEFTKRAYINGKLTLSGAEAVGGIIDAKSDKFLQSSLLQSEGSLSTRIANIRQRLLSIAASVFAFIDYPDEDMTDMPISEMKTRISDICGEISGLCGTHTYGRAISEGIRAAIVGKPNTGKSSVLNLICGDERVIVSDTAGTTRDVITEQVKLGDILLNLSDTAGIRKGGGDIEKKGIQKSFAELEKAELIIAVFDGTKPLDENDRTIIDKINRLGKQESVICLINKSDLHTPVITSPFECFIVFSAVDGSGLDALISTVAEKCGENSLQSEGEIITNARQYAALKKAKEALDRALLTLEGFSQEIAEADIEQALSALGEIDGRTVAEEVVSEIFSHFCVGK